MENYYNKYKLDTQADVNVNLNTFFKCFLEHCKTSDTKLQAQHKELVDKFDALAAQQTSLECQYKELELKHKHLQLEVSDLRASVNAMQQKNLTCDIIVRGIPEVESEAHSLESLASAILGSIGAPIDVNEIKDIRRLGRQAAESSKNEKKKRPILISFKTAESRGVVIAAKKKKKDLNCSNVTFFAEKLGTSTEKIYIEERLTEYSSKLFFEVRELKRKGVIKYVWINDGQILTRREEKERVKCITCEEDLNIYFEDDLMAVDEEEEQPTAVATRTARQDKRRNETSLDSKRSARIQDQKSKRHKLRLD